MGNLTEIKKINKFFNIKRLLKIYRMAEFNTEISLGDLIIRGEKYYIFLTPEYNINLLNRWNGEEYNGLKLSEIKKLLK